MRLAVLGLCFGVVVVCASSSAAQVQRQKLVASDAQLGDRFGHAVSVSGDWAIVGAHEDSDLGSHSGAAYLFLRFGTQWIETQKLHASDGGMFDDFGWSVSISGDDVVVGAMQDSAANVSASGSAYIFERVGTTWIETAKIWASDLGLQEEFGWSVAATTNRVVVGARNDAHAGFGSGSAYVFDNNAGTWTQTAKLTAIGALSGDSFGGSVSIDGDVALVGATGADAAGSNAGAAYVFQNFGGVWSQVTMLTANDALTNDRFGTSVVLGGNRIVVGATSHDHGISNSGAAYVFEDFGLGWTQTHELRAPDAQGQDKAGDSVAMNGDTLLVGAISDDDVGFSSGSATAFRFDGSAWVPVGKLLPRDGVEGDLFGVALGVADNSVVSGSYWADVACPQNVDCNSGAAYAFELAPDSSQYGSCTSGAPCANSDTHGGCLNSTGHGALLAAGGMSSCALDELVLQATHLPPSQNAIVFMGPASVTSTYGDGLRVVSSGGLGLRRFPLQQADATGYFLQGPGLVALSQTFAPVHQIAAGQTWNFQCWYRDPVGPCANTTNLSNGVSVAFTP